MALSLEGVSVHAKKRAILHELTLAVAPGERVVVIGANGAGKTTLLRTALGLVAPSSGRVTLDGHDVGALPPRERARRVGWLPQHALVGEALNVVDVVASARYRFEESRRDSERAALSALDRVGATGFAGSRITELSGGERQRIALATLLAQEPELLLLDEPASHLDPAQQFEVYALIGRLARAGLGILLVTHDVNLVSELGPAEETRILGLEQGRTAFRALLSAPDLPSQLGALFGIPFDAIAHRGRRLLVPRPLERP